MKLKVTQQRYSTGTIKTRVCVYLSALYMCLQQFWSHKGFILRILGPCCEKTHHTLKRDPCYCALRVYSFYNPSTVSERGSYLSVCISETYTLLQSNIFVTRQEGWRCLMMTPVILKWKPWALHLLCSISEILHQTRQIRIMIIICLLQTQWTCRIIAGDRFFMFL